MYNIETSASVGSPLWHRLGKAVPNDLTPEQMLVTAGLDWTVEKHPVFAHTPDGEIDTKQCALVRSSDKSVLDIVSPDWIPVQNHEAFEFFNDFVFAGDMEMNTAGSLSKGKIVWALAKMKTSFEVFGGDRVDGYLLFTNPHKFGMSTDVRFTPIRVVCQNTLTMALRTTSKNSVRVTHRTVFDAEAVKRTLGIASDQLSKYKEVALFLGSKRAEEKALNEFFKKLFPVVKQHGSESAIKEQSKNALAALSLMETQPGAEFAPGSWWQAFNAVTYMIDHKLGRSDEARLESAWFGPNKSKKIAALDLAVEYAKVA